MNRFNKKGVADSFSRAAATYDDFAHVQKRSAAHLADILPDEKNIVRILETGCGTGYYTSLLNEKFGRAVIFSIDVAFLMAYAASLRQKDKPRSYFITADAEQLPFSTGTEFDLITSNGVIQWFSDIRGTISRLSGFLSPNGMFAAAIFGNKTLQELSKAIREEISEDAAIAADTFPDARFISDIFGNHFKNIEIRERTIARTYPDLPTMLRTLKMTGVAPHGSRPIIKTRGDIKRIEKNYTMQTGRVMASYHVILVKAWGRKL